MGPWKSFVVQPAPPAVVGVVADVFAVPSVQVGVGAGVVLCHAGTVLPAAGVAAAP